RRSHPISASLSRRLTRDYPLAAMIGAPPRQMCNPPLLLGKLQATESARAVVMRRMAALHQRADRRQHCRVRAVQPPFVPPHAIESVAKIRCAIPLVGT